MSLSNFNLQVTSSGIPPIVIPNKYVSGSAYNNSSVTVYMTFFYSDGSRMEYAIASGNKIEIENLLLTRIEIYTKGSDVGTINYSFILSDKAFGTPMIRVIPSTAIVSAVVTNTPLPIDIKSNDYGNLPVNLNARNQTALTLLASAAYTANGNGSDIDITNYDKAQVCVNVTAVSGTSPTLTVYIDGKDTITGAYIPLGNTSSITATGVYSILLTGLACKYIRARYVIGGTTPSFTFSVTAEVKS